MFKDVCWSGMFPMKPGGATMIPGKSGSQQIEQTRKTACACGGDLTKGQLPRIGFTVGFWAPAKILMSRRPYCLPSLGGMELPFASINFLNGGANLGRSDRHEAFANWTLYSLIYMLRLIDDGACPPDGLTESGPSAVEPYVPKLERCDWPLHHVHQPRDAAFHGSERNVRHACGWGVIYPRQAFEQPVLGLLALGETCTQSPDSSEMVSGRWLTPCSSRA